MFDPTVFDNLKTVLEGAVYDYDLDGDLHIAGRKDSVDLANLTRQYIVTLAKNDKDITVDVELTNDTESWTGELLNNKTEDLGCRLIVRYKLPVQNIDEECAALRFQINKIWRDYKPQVRQDINHRFGEKPTSWTNTITLSFSDKIDESFIIELPDFLGYVYETLQSL